MADVIDVAQAVSVSYRDLQDPERLDDLLPLLAEAFGNGPDNLGILLVHDLPSDYPTLRLKALIGANKLAALPTSELMALENPSSKFLVGWSHGQEMLNGVADIHKGSFYFNPTHEYELNSNATDYPEYESPNVWPVLQDFEEDLMKLGRFIVEVGILVASTCDKYATSTIPGYEPDFLRRVVKNSRTCKARLLHYYPTATEDLDDSPEQRHDSETTWCGEHLDHGCLTGLTSAMYLASGPTTDIDYVHELNAPEDAGLFIRSRSGEVKQVKIPRTSLAFQTGEALQRITENRFCAVPHFVKGTKQSGIERNTMAVFMQPNLDDTLGSSGIRFKNFARSVIETNYADSL